MRPMLNEAGAPLRENQRRHEHLRSWLKDLASGNYDHTKYYWQVLHSPDWFYLDGGLNTERAPPSAFGSGPVAGGRGTRGGGAGCGAGSTESGTRAWVSTVVSAWAEGASRARWHGVPTPKAAWSPAAWGSQTCAS